MFCYSRSIMFYEKRATFEYISKGCTTIRTNVSCPIGQRHSDCISAKWDRIFLGRDLISHSYKEYLAYYTMNFPVYEDVQFQKR